MVQPALVRTEKELALRADYRRRAKKAHAARRRPQRRGNSRFGPSLASVAFQTTKNLFALLITV